MSSNSSPNRPRDECFICKKSFSNLAIHLRRVHKDSLTTAQKESFHRLNGMRFCNCHYGFQGIAGLNQHRKSSSNSDCALPFLQNSPSVAEIQTHPPVKSPLRGSYRRRQSQRQADSEDDDEFLRQEKDFSSSEIDFQNSDNDDEGVDAQPSNSFFSHLDPSSRLGQSQEEDEPGGEEKEAFLSGILSVTPTPNISYSDLEISDISNSNSSNDDFDLFDDNNVLDDDLDDGIDQFEVREDNMVKIIDLMGKFQSGLFLLNNAWLRPLDLLMVQYLGKINDIGENDSSRCFYLVALLILPGVINQVRFLHQRKRYKFSPIDTLRQLLSGNTNIIRLATEIDVLAGRRNTDGRVRSRKDHKMHLMKNITNLTKTGLLSKAANLLKPFSLLDRPRDEIEDDDDDAAAFLSKSPTTDEARAIMLQYYPEKNDFDILPDDAMPDDIDEQLATLLLTSGEVLSACMKANRSSANGSSGWTFCILQKLLGSDQGKQPDGLLERLTEFFNLCIRGELPEQLAELWVMARLVLVEKPGQANAWRPIAVGETFYRLLGRAINFKVAKVVAVKLMPIQLACGVPSGAEIGVRLAALGLQANDVLPDVDDMEEEVADNFFAGLFSCDISNAFGEQRRGHIWQGLIEHCPSLLPIFKSFYGISRPVRLSNGDRVGICETGLSQGDPLALLYFCVGAHKLFLQIQEILKSTQELFQEKRDDLIRLRSMPALLVTFADDINTIGDLRVLGLASPKIIRAIEAYGFRVAVHKSALVGKHVYRVMEQGIFDGDDVDGDDEVVMRGLRLVSDGVKVLGGYVGNEEYVSTMVAAAVDDMHSELPALIKNLDPQVAFTLLRYCINSRLTYLARVMELRPHMVDELRAYDLAVDEALARLAQEPIASVLPFHSRLGVLRSLPLKKGGLGIMRFCSFTSEAFQVKSRGITLDYAGSYCPWLERVATSPQGWPEITIGALDGITAALELNDQREDAPAARPSLPTRIQQCYDILAHSLMEGLVEDEEFALAAMLRSQSDKGTGRLFLWAGGSDQRLYVSSPTEYRLALRHRLLLPPVRVLALEGDRICCPCGTRYAAMYTDPFHATSCTKNAGLWKIRHDHMIVFLVAFIKLTMPDATIHREVQLSLANPDGTVGARFIIADIIVRMDHRVFVIDCSIVDPSAATVREQAAHVDDHAAKGKENDKRLKYARALVAFGPPGVQVTIGGHDQAANDGVANANGMNVNMNVDIVANDGAAVDGVADEGVAANGVAANGVAANGVANGVAIRVANGDAQGIGRGVGGVCFVPFVAEMTGRFGPAAKSFLETLQPGGSAAKTHFRNLVSTDIARMNSKLMTRTATLLRELRVAEGEQVDVRVGTHDVEGAVEAAVIDAAAEREAVAEAEAMPEGAEAEAVMEEATPDIEEPLEDVIARRTRSHTEHDKSQHGNRLREEESV